MNARCLRYAVLGFIGRGQYPYHRDGRCWAKGQSARVALIAGLIVGAFLGGAFAGGVVTGAQIIDAVETVAAFAAVTVAAIGIGAAALILLAGGFLLLWKG